MPTCGAHFGFAAGIGGVNLIVTAIEGLARVVTGRQAATLIAAQIAGAIVGVVIANLMFSEPLDWPGTDCSVPSWVPEFLEVCARLCSSCDWLRRSSPTRKPVDAAIDERRVRTRASLMITLLWPAPDICALPAG
jgi:hypothetical protein